MTWPRYMALLHVALCALSAGLAAPAHARGDFLANLQEAGRGASSAPQPLLPAAAVAPMAKVPTYALLGQQEAAATQQNISLQQLDAAFLEQNAALENANAALEQRNAALEVANAALEKNYAALEKRDASLATAYSSLRQGEEFLEQKFVMLQAQNAELVKNKTGTERAMASASKRVAQLEGANKALEEKAASLSTVLQSVQEVVQVLKGEVAASNKEMPGAVTDGILQQTITPASHAPDARTTQYKDSSIAAGGWQQQQQRQPQNQIQSHQDVDPSQPFQSQAGMSHLPAFRLQPSPLQLAMAQPMQFGPQGPLAMMSWSAPGTPRKVDMSSWAPTSNWIKQ